MKKSGKSVKEIRKITGDNESTIKGVLKECRGGLSWKTGFPLLKVLKSLSEKELLSIKSVKQFIHWRKEGWSGGKIRELLGMDKNTYSKWLIFFVEKGLLEKREKEKKFIWDDRILNNKIPATELAKELGCSAETIRKKRRKLIKEKLMEKLDFKEWFEKRENPLKGREKEISEVGLQMLECREKNLTAKETANIVGKSPAAVLIFWSKMIKKGKINKRV